MPEVFWNNKKDRFEEKTIKKRAKTRATRKRQTRYDERFDAFVNRGKKEWGIEYHASEYGKEIEWVSTDPSLPHVSRFYPADDPSGYEQFLGGNKYQSLMFFPHEFTRDLPSTVLTVDEVRENLHQFHQSTVTVKMVQFTIFDQPELSEHRVTVVTRDKLIEQIGQIAIATTDWEEIEYMVKGEPVLRIDLPPIVNQQKCRLHIDCRGHFSAKESFRDNLR